MSIDEGKHPRKTSSKAAQASGCAAQSSHAQRDSTSGQHVDHPDVRQGTQARLGHSFNRRKFQACIAGYITAFLPFKDGGRLGRNFAHCATGRLDKKPINCGQALLEHLLAHADCALALRPHAIAALVFMQADWKAHAALEALT